MGTCCGCVTKEKPVTEIAPNSQRTCTDLFLLFLFIAHWIVVIVIFATARARGGDPDLIIRPVDYLGRICGKTSGVQDLSFGAWPFPPAYQFKICVSDCNQTLVHPQMTYKYKSQRFVWYCVPILDGSINVTLSGDFESASEDVSRAMGDLFTAWPVILVSAFIALIFAFIYIAFLERCAGCMTWTGVLLLILGGFLLGYALIKESRNYQDTEVDKRGRVILGFGIAVVVGTFLFLCVVYALRVRIQIAIQVIKDASVALNDMRELLLFPIIPFLCGCAFLVWWISVTLYLFSVGSFKQVEIPQLVKFRGPTDFYPGVFNYSDFYWDNTLKQAAAIHFFSLLWNVEFLIYFGYMVAAGAIADWYFTPWVNGTRDKERGEGKGQLTRSPVRHSVWRTIRYHLGTICFGSLIIAIIQFLRATVKYIEERTKQVQGEPNMLQKCMFRCIHCCLWCAECCMDKISKNAFIWTCIYGDNFPTSCCSAFALIWRNLARVAAITMVGSYLMLMGKVVVALLTAGACGIFLTSNTYFKERLSSVLMPLLAIFFIAYLTACLFMIVFETVIDVTFLCFLVDEENNKAGTMLASEELQKLVGKFQPQSAALHAKEMSRTFSHKNLAQNPLPPGYTLPPGTNLPPSAAVPHSDGSHLVPPNQAGAMSFNATKPSY